MFYSSNAWLNPVGENLQKVAFNGHWGGGGRGPYAYYLCAMQTGRDWILVLLTRGVTTKVTEDQNVKSAY